MTQRIVIKNLEELGRFSDMLVPADEAQEVRALVPVVTEPTTEADLETLAEAASRAALELRHLAEADATARREAEEGLACYRRLRNNAGRLERVAVEAEALAHRAANLAKQAFDPNCREKAREIASAVAAVAGTARHRLAALTTELAALSVRDDVARLLAEERAREEAARREVEQRQREARLGEGIDRAEALARDQKFDEALRLLGSLRKIDPSGPALASSIEKIRRQQWAVKTGDVEKALREARRVYRREPRQALALLGPLDLSEMPEPLVRQVYGCWLQACRRLKLEGAVHYSPTFGKGAILVPADDGRLEVVSAIGLRRWKAGSRFSSAALKGARVRSASSSESLTTPSWGRPAGRPQALRAPWGDLCACRRAGQPTDSLSRKGGGNVSKEERFKVYTRSVWQQDYGARAGRPASWRESVAPAVGALLGELRRCADEESLRAAYWEPGDWPAQVLLRRLPSDPGPETLLELEHAAFWLRWQELAEAE